MLGDQHPFGLVDGVRQTFRRISDVLPEVQRQLIRIIEITFTPLLKRPLQKIRDLKLLVIHLLFERGDRLLLAIHDPGHFGEQSLAGGQIVRNEEVTCHAP